ncbi:MAG: hypothetical protein M1825_002528 [Sarcosagium campestre]|nr:MAG: hypothetical protein M1825_002528 [Sarcosagium campestre]
MPATHRSKPPASTASVTKAQVRRLSPSTPYLQPVVAFYCFFLPNLIAALYAPIQDCDETFNYWEPTHYLGHGFGLQTWEYSPEYAIRSWFYIALHAIVGRLGMLLPFTSKVPLPMTPVNEFYIIRAALALACALCQTRLFNVISRALNPRVGMIFLACLVFSPGMFHASAAFLPSSFAMYTAMLGMSAFMHLRGGAKTAEGIMWFGIGGIVGWPFAIALAVPYLLEEFVFMTIANIAGVETILWRLIDGTVRSLIVLALSTAVDVFFYHKVEIIPFNIVWYNVFSQGPDIFGTEPWHFYIRNLILNFNIWFLLALAALPLAAVQHLFGLRTSSLQSPMRSIVVLSPFYLWFIIFSAQPHKEERFMYPAYPALALNAAVAVHIILVALGSTKPKTLAGKLSPRLKLAAAGSLLLLSITAGLFRTLGILTAYSAPMQVHKALQEPQYASQGGHVCYSKEWYRFPSSYFLPDGYRAKFVKSEFNGLLPGEFSEAKTGFGLWPTWLVPSGMNNMNEEDLGKYVDVSRCTFLVDSYFPHLEPTRLEPHYILDEKDWEKVACSPFLDTRRTGQLGRMIWLPDLDFLPPSFRRSWGEYCLLRRRVAK